MHKSRLVRVTSHQCANGVNPLVKAGFAVFSGWSSEKNIWICCCSYETVHGDGDFEFKNAWMNGLLVSI